MKKPKQSKNDKGLPKSKARSKRQSWLRYARRSYGHTEKILRRNRKLWARKHSKEGRQLDKDAIKKSLGQT